MLGQLLAGRFRLRAQLGRGGFGTVYEAQDEQSGGPVAIKHLTRVSGTTIYRFKKEFRAVADRHHPNLVRLYELFSDGSEWFFSMELVPGQRFDTYVLGERPHVELPSTSDESAVAAPPVVRGADAAAVARLRPALAQLVAGVAQLHALGVVHRDLKPGNVLVTPGGRVVLLDFGLATEVEPDAEKSSLGQVLGTPMYMAPEQGLGRAATPASDWYAVGVMLFEVLHGRPPFVGTANDVLTQKLAPEQARLPQALAAAAPELDALCRRLLSPEPSARPDEPAIRAVVSGGAPPADERPSGPLMGPRAPFVGRARELITLRQALSASRSGKTVVARVRGSSGVGKSALLEAFLGDLAPEALVLKGRCYERESVPYKAFDGVVDALTRHLARLPDAELLALIPPETQALVRLFPVFSRLKPIADQPQWLRSISPHEERRRGFTALKELLIRISAQRPLVVVIDDLQWGDLDSIEPLRELAGRESPLRMLLVLASRAEDETRSPALVSLTAAPIAASAEDECDIELAPLELEEARALAEALLPPAERHRAEEVARESGGLPLFVPELARAQRGDPGAVSLEAMLRARVQGLGAEARKLLEVLALAGRPLRRQVAAKAAGLSVAQADVAALELAREHLARVTPGEGGVLETFHDRVRETVGAALPFEAAQPIHAALAAALAEAPVGEEEGEALAVHYRLAGDLARARPAAVAAAQRAFDAFAFERAIALYGSARDGAASDERRALTAKLADVLAYAGRNLEAAREYLASAEGAPPREAQELRRRAAELFLRAGRVDEGIPLGQELLAAAGVPWRTSRAGLIGSVLAQKALLRLRGGGFNERPLEQVDPDAVARVDLFWSLGASLSAIDPVRSTDYLARHLRGALSLGEPYRVSRGLAMEGLMQRIQGGSLMERGEENAERAWVIAQRIDHPHALGWSALARAVVDWSAARWRAGAKKLEEGLQVMAFRDPETFWQIAITEIWFRLRNYYYLGELGLYCAESERATRAAEDRGDLLSLLSARSSCLAPVLLIRGESAQAREACTAKFAEYTRADAWYVQHQESLRTLVLCDLYEGDPAAAMRRIRDAESKMARAMMLHSEAERWLTLPVFVLAAVQAKDADAAEKWGRTLEKQRYPAAQVWARAAAAGVLALRGDPSAPDAYERAAAAFDGIETPLFAAAARRRRGALLGGNDGARLIEAADALLASRGVANPERFSRVLIG